MHRITILLTLAALAIALGACTVSAAPDATPAATNSEMLACPSPRPEVCTREYRPVCAQRDTGIRCVTTPCPSAESVTLASACSACSDPKVISYRPGACP